MQVYLAGPLFSLAERTFNETLARAVESSGAGLEVALPQERAKAFLGRPDAHANIYRDCLETIEQADVVAAILDGADIDSGTALELGYALALRKPVIGLRTDFRASEERGVNLMVAFACDRLVYEGDSTVATLANHIVAFCRGIEPRAAGSRHDEVVTA